MPRFAHLRTFGALAMLVFLSACAGRPQMTAQQEAGEYRGRAARVYHAPGPASDPWGPYVAEASQRFDVPERWIREVMRQESGGKALAVSGPGAMGLMQVMPGTYDELRGRYPDLGGDAYDPHDNIMAGTAYIRELYDIYGSPGFLAAYNAGPGRLDDYLTRGRTLPGETRRYVAAIGPRIANASPNRASPGAAYAMNALPMQIPDGSRYARDSRYSGAPALPTPLEPVQVASEPPPPPRPAVQIAALPEPPRPIVLGQPTPQPATSGQFASLAPRPIVLGQPTPAQEFAALAPRPVELARPLPAPPPVTPQFASYTPPAPSHGGFRLVAPAMAEPLVRPRGAGGGNWAVQVGALANDRLAAAAITTAKEHAHEALANSHGTVTGVRQAGGTLYRARLNGLSHEGAQQACERLMHQHMNCILVSPDAQS